MQRSKDFTRKRKETRTEPNPFLKLPPRVRRSLVAFGVVAEAARIGGGRHHKATYSRTLGGKLKNANIEVVFHLRQAAQRMANAMNALTPEQIKAARP